IRKRSKLIGRPLPNWVRSGARCGCEDPGDDVCASPDCPLVTLHATAIGADVARYSPGGPSCSFWKPDWHYQYSMGWRRRLHHSRSMVSYAAFTGPVAFIVARSWQWRAMTTSTTRSMTRVRHHPTTDRKASVDGSQFVSGQFRRFVSV